MQAALAISRCETSLEKQETNMRIKSLSALNFYNASVAGGTPVSWLILTFPLTCPQMSYTPPQIKDERHMGVYECYKIKKINKNTAIVFSHLGGRGCRGRGARVGGCGGAPVY